LFYYFVITFPEKNTYNVAHLDLFPSPEVFWVIKSRRVKLEGDVARVGGGKCLKGFGDVTCLEKDHLEELRIDERI
jgi:hypothetical protein